MTKATKVAIVTGANRGLGLALVRGLCRALGEDAVVYLGARDEGRGERAVRELEAEGLRPRFARLDVADDASVAALAARVAGEHGRVDVVISNAAMPLTPGRPQRDQVEAFVETNNGGTRRMIRAFGPLLADGARFLIVASGLGRLRFLSPPARDRFDLGSLRLDDVDALLREFVQDTLDGSAQAKGWGSWINVPSKVAQVAAAAIFARELAAEAARRDLLVNAVCPGLVDTEASRPWFSDMSRALSPDAAAADVVWLATLPPGTREPYGALVQRRRVLPFAELVEGKTAAELLAAMGIKA
ncbi:MAG TPA: SDR family NAD(P)-dependent oxidoreductase [Polyangiaceae bacterium]|nr:SDR family NAD(P)-dependent oxidoreductase [Polyangiaceae bacterium]